MRNIILTLLFLAAFSLMSMQPTAAAPVEPTNSSSSRSKEAVPAPRKQTSTISWESSISNQSVPINSSLTLSANLRNNSTVTTTVTIEPTAIPNGWDLRVTNATRTIAPRTTSAVSFVITAPDTATGNQNFVLKATASDGTAVELSFLAQATSPTATNTPTNTPTRTSTPTPTNAPICPEGTRDPGNDFDSAKLIVVDSPNNHGICTVGDVDWFKFVAIGGKVYTPDITRFDIGLDLSIELFDSDGNPLAYNDDFFARTPQPTAAGNQTPLPTRDIGPRIQSWRAPKDGMYYIRIADRGNVGGGNRTYTFVVFSESYGATPSTIAEICRDMFEEDGLPEEAKLITSNEVQRGHVLCPTGDADWVKFFGKTGKTYYIYTDTRPYANKPSANPNNTETQAGADTVLYLADRDGVSIIAVNDDIEGASGSSLDSQIRFVPQVDGFYFAQVKNTGDIGNQFIKYDIVLTLCLPGRDDCGRAQTSSAPQPTSGPTQTPVSFDRTPTATFTPTPTTTQTPTSTPTSTTSTGSTDDSQFLEQSIAGEMVDGPIAGFADPAFASVWYRTDQLVASGQVTRSWLWGPRGRMARTESYAQLAGGIRQVQYFDKARMEVSDSNGDRSKRWFVTTGLLVAEMVTGRMQVGNNEFVEQAPATMPVAGDVNDSSSPNYASFRSVVVEPAADRSGQTVIDAIDRDGKVYRINQEAISGAKLVRYVAETGHNIPQAFWDYINAQGPVQEGKNTRIDTLMDWVFTLGYPISEPYWMKIRVAGAERSVLVQLFQRRVLTYDPVNPANWQVEMGNVGRHYYVWRYGVELPGDR